MNTVELLKKITTPVGVSGDENNEIVPALVDMLKPYGDVQVDCMNNVFCTIGEGYHFLLDAHLDEIGMVVKSITDDGFVKVDKCGGIDCRMLLASEVTIHGKEDVKGIVSTLPPHLQKDDNKKAPEIDDIAIDIGMSKQQAEDVISLGDRVTFKRNFTQLLNNQVSSSCLDDRVGVASILLAIDMLKDVDAKITVMFSSQEEIGIRGAKIGPYSKKVDEAICVDVSFGYTPFSKKEDCGIVGQGPMIGISPILDKSMYSKLTEVANKNNITYQTEVMGGGSTGTNADVITVCENGIKTALISIAQKYMHSPIEVVDTSDVENTAKLIACYVKERAGEINA